MINDLIFQQLPTAYLVLTPEFEIVDVNAAYEVLSGRRRHDLAGEPVFQAFPPAPEALDEQGRNPLRVSLELARDTGTADVLPLIQYDVADPDGVVRQRFWSLIHMPILGVDGTTEYLVQRVLDVTDWVGTTTPPGSAVEPSAARLAAIEAELLIRVQELHQSRAAAATAAAALLDSETRARAVLDTAGDGIILMDAAGLIESMNPAAERLFYRAGSDVAGLDLHHLVVDPLHPARRWADQLAAHTTPSRVLQVTGHRADASTFPAEMVISHGHAATRFSTAVLRDVTERRALEERLAHQSAHDPLTGLANRTALLDRLDHAHARLARQPGHLAVFFIDLNRFKPVNDQWGHTVGDDLLVVVARRLRCAVRGDDTIARWGGDEFVVLCEGVTAATAEHTAQRIHAHISKPVELTDTVTIIPSVSIGYVTDDGTSTPDQLITAADHAMYQHKNNLPHPRRPGNL